MAAGPFITVVICTRNHVDQLMRALKSLRLQQCDRNWEVLVVDNRSSDDTAVATQNLVAQYPVPLHVVQEPETGLTRARNRGIREARGTILLCADDDVTFREGWLQAHAKAFANPELVGSAGKVLPVLPQGAPDWVAVTQPTTIGGPTARYDFGDQPADITPDSGIALPFGANMGIRRDAAERLGGFRTDLGWGSRYNLPGDETEFFERLQGLGGRIAYVPSAAVDHHIALNRLTMEYYEAWSEGFGRLKIVKHPPQNRLKIFCLIVKYAGSVGLAMLRMALQQPGQEDLARLHLRTRLATRRGALRQLLNR